MEAYKRRQAILSLLEKGGEVKIADLAARFGVSANSIRNDLKALAAAGRLKRVRGGAVASSYPLPPYASPPPREYENLGRWAASLVQDHEAIVLDGSDAVLQMTPFLLERRHLTIVVGGLEAARLLAQNPTHRIILAANIVQGGTASLVGDLRPDLLSGFRASHCFLSGDGLSVEHGLTEANGEIAQLKAQMIRLADRVVALVDHGKIGRVGAFRTADLHQIDHLITDAGIAPEVLVDLRRSAPFSVTVVGPSSAETLLPLDGRGRRRYCIGFGNLTERMVFAQQVRWGLEKAARGMENVALMVRDNNLDRQTALENADAFVANGVNLVIEYQVDAEAGNVIMDKFQRAHIPVIAVDIPLPGATFFGADNYRAGRMAGEGLGHWIRRHWGGKVDFVLRLTCQRVGPVAMARLQGQLDGLSSVIGPVPQEMIHTVDGPVILEDVPVHLADWVAALSPRARGAIIAINDDAALGALAAFGQADRLHQVVAVGQNVDLLGRVALRQPDLPFIGSTAYYPEQYGERLLALALRLLRGEAVPPAVYVPHVFVTKENIDQIYPPSEEEEETLLDIESRRRFFSFLASRPQIGKVR